MTRQEIEECLSEVGLLEGKIVFDPYHFDSNKDFYESDFCKKDFDIYKRVVGVLKIHETSDSEKKYKKLGTHTITFQRFSTKTMEVTKSGTGFRFYGKTKDELLEWLQKFEPATEEILDHVYFVRNKRSDESRIKNAIKHLQEICELANLKYCIYVEGFSEGEEQNGKNQ